MNKLIKQLSYLGFSLLAFISTFLAYSTLSVKALNGADVTAIKSGLNANDGIALKFFEYIGDFADKSQVEKKITTIMSAILLALAILCIGVMLYTVIMSFIKGDAKLFEQLHMKWVSVAAFTFCLLSLLLALIFPDLPKSQLPTVYEIKASVGIGSILFLIATGLAAIFSFVHPKLLKD